MIPVIGQLVGGVLSALQALGYPGIATVVGLESMGIPMPGETTLIAASYLAATGHFSLPLVISSAALGAVVGDSIGYAIGRKGGRRFLNRHGKYVRITPEKLTIADRYFVRHGAKTVFLGRFLPLLRILAGPLAGTAKMPYRRFLAANVAGALTWATTMGTLAFFFGRLVAAFLSSLGVWGLVAIAALLLARFAFRRWRRDRERRLAASKAVRPAVEYPRT
jgi:membrane protein DedA with SNARE-associated domain